MIKNILDRIDLYLTMSGIIKPASWELISITPSKKLYAGRLSRILPQYRTHIGITPFHPSTRNIPHDLTQRFPLPDDLVETFQAEDVFEHIDYASLPAIFREIHRILVPGGLFRLSVPDYRNSIYAGRTVRDDAGQFQFDPGGGGRWEGGRVVDGGHIWFPTIENVTALFEQSPFREVQYLQYNTVDGAVLKSVDYSLGYIQRTVGNDPRAQDEALSIVVDAYK